MDCCRLFVAMDISFTSARPSSRTSSLTSYTLDDMNMWNVSVILACLSSRNGHHASPSLGFLALPHFLRRHVDAGLFVGTGQMETSTRRTSADLLCDDLSILSRSPGPLHLYRPLSRVFSPCRWTTTLMRTESGRLHLSFMRGSLMWTGSGMSQMSFSPHV